MLLLHQPLQGAFAQMNIEIRPTTEVDYPAIVKVTREAFWNLYVPGCDEHYLAHIMHTHPDYLPQLCFAVFESGTLIASIQYTRSHVITNTGEKKETCTFGPVSVEPRYQRQGIGGKLIGHSLQAAAQMGYKAVLTLGSPYNYFKHGFRGSKDFAISDSAGKFPFGLIALELEKGFLGTSGGKFYYSDVYQSIDPKAVEEFDAQFEVDPERETGGTGWLVMDRTGKVNTWDGV
jgi:predicted N-acetyltransferase YhbS